MSLMAEDGLVIGHYCWPDDEGWACPHCEPVGEKMGLL